MRVFGIVYILALFFIFFPYRRDCFSDSICFPVRLDAFTKIRNHVVDLTSFNPLFECRFFREINNNPDLYYSRVMATLENVPENNFDIEKSIMILSVQGLSPDYYHEYCSKLLSLFHVNKITSNQFKMGVFQRLYPLREKYFKLEKTKKFFKRMQDDPKIPEEIKAMAFDFLCVQ